MEYGDWIGWWLGLSQTSIIFRKLSPTALDSKCFASSKTTYKNRVVVLFSDRYRHKHYEFVWAAPKASRWVEFESAFDKQKLQSLIPKLILASRLVFKPPKQTLLPLFRQYSTERHTSEIAFSGLAAFGSTLRGFTARFFFCFVFSFLQPASIQAAQRSKMTIATSWPFLLQNNFRD